MIPVVNTASEYMYQMATIAYHTLHGTQTVVLPEDVTADDGTVYKAGTYEFPIEGRYWSAFDRSNPIEAAAREQAWTGTAHALIANLGVGSVTGATIQMGFALAGLFAALGATIILTGGGLVWAVRAPAKETVAGVPHGTDARLTTLAGPRPAAAPERRGPPPRRLSSGCRALRPRPRSHWPKDAVASAHGHDQTARLALFARARTSGRRSRWPPAARPGPDDGLAPRRPSLADAQARAENATTIATIFVNPRQFNEAADYQRYPRDEARDLAICEEEGLDLVFAPPVDGGLPGGFDTLVTRRRGRAAARRRGPARAFRRRGHGRRDPVRPRRRRSSVLRPEGRPAGHGHSPDGPRPRDPDRGRRLPDRPRAGRPGAVVTERPPLT